MSEEAFGGPRIAPFLNEGIEYNTILINSTPEKVQHSLDLNEHLVHIPFIPRQHPINLIAVFCNLSWRVFRLMMLNRTPLDADPIKALAPVEYEQLERVVRDKAPLSRKPLSHYLLKAVRLDGYLARVSDPPPGNIVTWWGTTRLTDISVHPGTS